MVDTPAARSTSQLMQPDVFLASSLKYVLITPARNEAAFLEEVIRCVVSQSQSPLKWIIVSDGSIDDTDNIVNRYAALYPWIELVRMPERRERHFAGKVTAFKAGQERLAGLHYDIIGNLDADITFDNEYFAFLMARFEENPRLGVGGTPFREENEQYDYRFTSVEHVSGACQLFRRQCFEDIGGYTPIRIGGIDLVAVISARMKGWQTRSFLEKTCMHHRKMGTAKRSALMVAFKGGQGDYMLGTHPAWEFSRTFYQMTKPPILLGGLFRTIGFFWAMVKRQEKVVSDELVAFRRAEQMQRLKGKLTKIVRLG
jgi:poly-beta-1,6-N-acetyl-D-glucosamine synthase